MTVLSDGDIATRCLTPRPEPTVPTTLAAGAYDEADVPALLVGPEWTAMNITTPDRAIERVQLDMFRGVLTTEVERAMAWSCAAPGSHRSSAREFTS